MTRLKASLEVSSNVKRRARTGRRIPPEPTKRTVFPERGIVLNSFKHGELEKWLTEDITALDWEIFVEPPSRARAEIVTLFLEAVKNGSFPKLTIKGVEVNFSAGEINETFNTASVPTEEDEYEKYCAAREDAAITDEVLKRIGSEGATWGAKESIRRKHLKFEAKVWMHFINSRLMPVSNDSRVNWERAVLVFCILSKKRFDVGRIIYKQLVANAPRPSPFFFPCLVTEMCKRSGLKAVGPIEEEIIPDGADIDQSTIKRIRENEGLDSEEEEEKEEGEEKKEEERKEKGEEEEKKEEEGRKEEIKPETSGTKKSEPAHKKKKAKKGPAGPEHQFLINEDTYECQTMFGLGADLLAIQMQAVQDSLGRELKSFKEASLLIAKEKDALQMELERLQGAGAKPMKRPLEEGESSNTLQSMVKELAEAVGAMGKQMEAKELAHEQERKNWQEELELLRTELKKNREEEIQLRQYVKARDQVFASNWGEKFKGQTPYPLFPDVLPPEAIENAPTDGAEPSTKEQ